MARYLMLTAVGQDRPGLVAGVTEALLENGCNVEDSTMTRLRGDFAMILLLKHPDAPVEPLRARLGQIQDKLNLWISLREVSERDVQTSQETGGTFHISVYGADKAGIVHAITERLAVRGADITDLRTTMAGTMDHPIYVMQLEAVSRPDDDPSALAQDITQAGADLGVDVTVQLLEPMAL